MTVSITHTTPADDTFSPQGAAAWNQTHTVSGLGTIATQDANNVTITGGSISNITDLAVADGGTGASTAQDARNNLLPSQGSNTGKFLKTDGTNVSWASVDALPSQTGNDGKYLKTDGSTASWDLLDISTSDITGTLPVANGGTGGTTASAGLNNLLPSQSSNTGKFLKTDGSNASWASVDALPSQSGNNGKYLTTDGSTASWGSLGTMAAQNSNNVSITGGTIGGQDVTGFGQTVIFSKLNLMGF